MRRRFSVVIALVVTSVAVGALALTIPTWGGSNSRVGEYQTATLDVGNVHFGAFGKVFEYPVTGFVYGQPILVDNVSIPGVGTRNVTYIATDQGELSAWDQNSATLFWKITAPLNVGERLVRNDSDDNATAYSTSGVRCHFHHMSGGINSTPAVDTATQTIYFVSWKDIGGGPPASRLFAHVLYAYDLRSGAYLRSQPIGGTSPGASGTTITFNSFLHFQRPGLLFANGNVYVGFGSIDDKGPAQGWVFAYRASDFTQVGRFCSTCSAQTPTSISCPLPGSPGLGPGGIWQAGAGLTADPSGNVYVFTGNGPSIGAYGESAVKLSPTLSVLAHFTPSNADVLSAGDVDLASSGPLYIPPSGTAPAALLGGGKEGKVYVMAPSTMSLLQTPPLQVTTDQGNSNDLSHIHGPPVYWAENRKIFVWGERDYLVRLSLSATNQLSVDARATDVPQVPMSSANSDMYGWTMPGGMLALSRNSGSGNAIVWAMTRATPWYTDVGGLPPTDPDHHSKCAAVPGERRCAHEAIGPGVLRAINASTLKQLWYSERTFTFPKPGYPSISNNRVYVPTLDNKVLVYGPCTGCGKNPTSRNDYDADNKSDFAVWRPSGSLYYFQPSYLASNVVDRMRTWEIQIGQAGDVPVTGDFDGDGRADVCVWRSANHSFIYLPSSKEYGSNDADPLHEANVHPNYSGGAVQVTVAAALPGDIPVSGDFDGDGKTDFVLRRASNATFYVHPSGGAADWSWNWGNPEDVPLAADFDADGITDFALRRSANFTFYVHNSASGLDAPAFQWGLYDDVPALGDYDGDGKADYAIWRKSTHEFIIKASSTNVVTNYNFGMSSDIPTPGDYDGDGKTDLALRRASDASFHWRTIASSTENVFAFGNVTDVPVAQLIGNPITPAIQGR